MSLKIERDENEKPKIIVNMNNSKNILSIRRIFINIKTIKYYLRREVKEIVIIVPSYFKNNQRQSAIMQEKLLSINNIYIITLMILSILDFSKVILLHFDSFDKYT